jgi:prepilin-type processing-associated H-X9-DG protein
MPIETTIRSAPAPEARRAPIRPTKTAGPLGGLPAATRETQIQAIKEGALFVYCGTEKLYKCPSGLRGEMRTYAIVDSMNGWPSSGPHIKKRTQITRPGERSVFLDEGWVTFASWSVPYDREAWWGSAVTQPGILAGDNRHKDPPPVRHGDGTDFSFADGHSEYWKWLDRRTIEYGKMMPGSNPLQPGNPDLHRAEGGLGQAGIRAGAREQLRK